MSSKRAFALSGLINSVHSIRNVCILAHVDHGKTTMADALLATNGIVSFRQAGKLRYMDNTEAEQERGITMKSSVVGLRFCKRPTSDRPCGSTFLVNLVDSPGHVDFASEVSTAVRLCDAAVIVVDVVESVCPQTRAVLRQAWNERLTLILVLNKIDRLILEMKLAPSQAYEVLCRVIEQVNSVLAEMFTADVFRRRDDAWQCAETDQSVNTSSTHKDTLVYDLADDLSKTDDSNLYFSPERGNVVFSSALDSWGFRPMDFLNTWSSRLGVSAEKLNGVIWGDFYLSKTPGCEQVQFKPDARKNKHRPLFVQLILEPLWKTYQTLIIDGNQNEVSKMADKLGVRLDPRSIRNTDSRNTLRALMTTWLPLGQTLLEAITDICPDPSSAVSADRAVHMFYGDNAGRLPARSDCTTCTSVLLPESSSVHVNQTSRSTVDLIYAKSAASMAVQSCSSSPEAPTIVFVAKVFWTDKLHMTGSHFSRRKLTADESATTNDAVVPDNTMNKATLRIADQPTLHQQWRYPDFSKLSALRFSSLSTDQKTDLEFVALARIFSGTVRPGQRLFVLGPKFDGSKIPRNLLNADPAELPVGPVRIRTDGDNDGLISSFNISLNHSDDLLGSSPVTSPGATLSGSESVGSSSGCFRPNCAYLRHVYVAVIVGIFQFLGGQHDLMELSDSVPAGNIVGLTGPDLIAFLPKSGLLVSRLSLVAAFDADSEFGLGAPVLPLAGIAVWHGAPVISVAVEPASASNPDDVTRLERGLRLLDRADPCAEIALAPSGEYLIKAAGEVHLQKCLEDLAKFFAPDVEVHVSPFVVPFRETIISSGEDNLKTLESISSESSKKAHQKLESMLQHLDRYDEHLIFSPDSDASHVTSELNSDLTEVVDVDSLQSTSGFRASSPLSSHPSINPTQKREKRERISVNFDLPQLPIGYFQLPYCKTQTRVLLRVSAYPLPDRLVHWAETRGCRKIPQLIRAFKTKSPSYSSLVAEFNKKFSVLCAGLTSNNSHDSASSSPNAICWTSLSRSFLALGPNQVGPNMLFSRLKSNSFPIFTAWGQQIVSEGDTAMKPYCCTIERSNSLPLISYAKALLRGFQLATERGPLCAEPMRGVMFIVEEICAEDCHFLEVPKLRNRMAENPDRIVENDVEYMNENQRRDGDDHSDITDVIKQENLNRRKKSRRLTSVSWLDELGEGDDEDFFSDDDFDWNTCPQEQSDEDLSDPKQSAVEDFDEKPNHLKVFVNDLKDIAYWSRREDGTWLQDVPPGLLTSAMNRACLAAFQSSPGQRLMLSMYDVQLQSRPDVLGRMFAVLRKRHGYVVSEDFREGENIFIINARLPVIESFGLADELRSRTSGVVSLPQLRPGGWELLDIDPTQKDGESIVLDRQDGQFPTVDQSATSLTTCRDGKASGRTKKHAHSPGSDDDVGQADELTAQISRVRTYIKNIRLRKGLPTNEQLVLYADKQRTLKKNK